MTVKALTKRHRLLDYSLHQCQRWLDSYRAGGLAGLLENRIAERDRREWTNSEAWEALQAALKQGEIATYKQARALLAEHGVRMTRQGYRAYSAVTRSDSKQVALCMRKLTLMSKAG